MKGLVYLVYPPHGMKMLKRVSLERAWEFVVAGVVLIAFGSVITYSLLAREAL